MNQRNIVLTVSNARCYCAFIGLVTPRSPKFGLSYLKTEARGVVSNIVTRSHARVREVEGVWGGSACVWAAAARVVGEAVHTCGQRCSGLQWPELMVEAAYGGWS
jgi:hypothetical protein